MPRILLSKSVLEAWMVEVVVTTDGRLFAAEVVEERLLNCG